MKKYPRSLQARVLNVDRDRFVKDGDSVAMPEGWLMRINIQEGETKTISLSLVDPEGNIEYGTTLNGLDPDTDVQQEWGDLLVPICVYLHRQWEAEIDEYNANVRAKRAQEDAKRT